jgi:hypothetical protein
VCDVEGCGIILEKNCTDGCGTGGYGHLLYYDDAMEAQAAIEYVKYTFDVHVERRDEASGYRFNHAYAVAFVTEEEFSEEQAQELFQMVSPDAYDLNNDLVDDGEDEVEDDFPEVFTEDERDLAIVQSEDNDWTIEYIRRLERVACAAFAYYARSQSKGYHSEPKLAHALYEELATVNFMKR